MHFTTLLADSDMNAYACARWNDDERFVIVFNNSQTPWVLDLPLHATAHGAPAAVGQYADVLSGETYAVAEGKIRELSLPPWAGIVLRGE